MKRLLDQVVLHEQMEHDVSINNNLSTNQVDWQFETPIRVYQIK